jgi:hypothetical protein
LDRGGAECGGGGSDIGRCCGGRDGGAECGGGGGSDTGRCYGGGGDTGHCCGGGDDTGCCCGSGEPELKDSESSSPNSMSPLHHRT